MSSNEDRLRMARLATLGTQMSVMVHELRQPLFALKTYLELHGDSQKEDPKFRQNISEQVHRMEELITRYGLQGREQSTPQRLDFNLAVSQTAAWMRHRASQYGVTLLEDLSDDQLTVLTCPNNAHQVAFNLIQNAYEAIKLGPGKGEVVVRTGRHGSWVRLEVEDTAGGLSEELVERAMDPFVTTKALNGGTGLGLYVVRTIVEAAEGSFRLVNGDRGLRAEVDLPRVA